MTTNSIDTAVVHAGEPRPRLGGAVSMPIFQTSTYLYEEGSDYHTGRYVRLSNSPNHEVLHSKLAALENAEAALVTASGMAAISTSLLTVLGAGDHLLILDAPYGGTRGFVTEDLPRFGISHTFIDGSDPETWRQALRPETRAIYLETITNPLMQVPDLEAAVAFAKTNELVSMVDNTFASPVNFRPAEIGFDLSLHSCTKYLNGHHDLAAGAVIGHAHLVDRIRRLLNHLGGSLDPHACFLLHRGVKTVALRVRRQNQSALKIAQFLENHPAIKGVNYPGLESHPAHQRACRVLDGFGGMVSFDLHGGLDAANRLLERVTIPVVAPSLGGVDSLIILPAATAYANVPRAERERVGVTESLVRLSVGIEDADELIADLGQALEESHQPSAISHQQAAAGR
ncbi:MAG: trans-sulfuration enzyme family protein [Planctomycetota bacterium]|jgi:cystathionine beta-lyase/cystathionine gamma-synthase